MKKNYSLPPLTILFVISLMVISSSCKTSIEEKNITFFGGKIKNPKGEYVYFAKDEIIIDSAKINENNRFKFSLDSIEEGIYTFKHGPEYQYLYLQPKDSLLIYLNTWDFDESLIFSGKGGAKNNFLISLFLQQEENEKRFKHLYQLEEKEFEENIELQTAKLKEQYQELMENEDHETTEFFNKVARVAINYPFYYLKENYPFYYRKIKNLKEFPELSDEFYAYRNAIDLNDESILYYGPNYSFLRAYLNHLAWYEKIKNPDSVNVDLSYMKIVNDKIKIKKLKNDLLANGIWSAITNEYVTNKDLQEIKEFFFTNCTDEELKKDIEKSLYQKERLNKGDTLPKIMLLNDKNEEVEIHKIIEPTPTVIYFWPKDLGKIEMLIEQKEYLMKKYPNYSFIGIERDKSYDNWIKFVSEKHLDPKHQFKIDKNSNFYSWFDCDMARTVLLDKNGIVLNGYLYFGTKTFDNYLKKP